MYLIHLAARLDPYSLQEEAPIAPVHFPAAAANTSPLFQLLQGAHELQTPDDTLTSLLEKAYALYAETCLGPESSTSWDALDPRLEAVIKFNPPAVLSHLSNDALSPEMFCMYATAYLWALGNAADAAKLQSIQHALKRRGAKRSSSQSEALQALSAAAPAAMQMALEKQFSKLQPEVHALLQRPAHTVPDNPAAPIDLLHTDQTLQSLLRTSAEPALPPIESHSQENAAVQIRSGQEQSIAEASAPQQEQQPMADAPVQQQIVASSEDRELPAEQQAEIAEATAVEPAALATTAVEDPAYRKLLASVFDMLKRCYTWWKSNAGKAVDAAHQTLPVDKVKADALLSRSVCTDLQQYPGIDMTFKHHCLCTSM